MYSRYVKETVISEKNENEQNEELLKNLKESKIFLENMHKNLQFVEEELIDYYAYQIKAEEAKYNYLLKLAKKKKLEVS